MTREEAMTRYNAIKARGDFCEYLNEEMVDMAIKALEESETVTEFADRCRECGAKYGKLLKQEPCEDAISRQAVLDAMYELCNTWETLEENPWRDNPHIDAITDAIDNLPSVNLQEPNWDRLYSWLNDMRLGIAPDETVTDIDERNVRTAQVDLLDEIMEWIEKHPQEPKIGHWISHREHCENLGVIPSGLGFYEWCSNCDCGIDVEEWYRNHYNYCPNCGAKMESEG